MNFQIDVAAVWRDMYMPRYNALQHQQHFMPVLLPPAPIPRSISPDSSVDSVYWSLSESGALSPASDTSRASSASSMLAPPARRNKNGFIYSFDMKSQGYRIDRLSFEQLKVVCGSEGVESLFKRIMGMTSTMIHWPVILRSDDLEDPFIRITGIPKHIVLAKRALFGSFLIPGELSKLHLIIPKCDIDRILGYTLETITESSGSRIYFEKPKPYEPDSTMKVVVYGPVACLERGRNALRSAAHFVITFEMFISTELQSLIQHQWIQQLECLHDVKISFYFTKIENIHQIVIEGTENEAQNISDVVEQLTAYNLEHIITPVFQLIMAVSKQALVILNSDDKAIIRTITRLTNTEIDVVDTLEEDGSSKLIICGFIDDIYMAKRELVGFVPIEMFFEIENSGQEFDGIKAIATKYDLELTIYRRDDQNVIIIQLKGTERYVSRIYDAQQEILSLQVKLGDIKQAPVPVFGGQLECDYSTDPCHGDDYCLNIQLPELTNTLFGDNV